MIHNSKTFRILAFAFLASLALASCGRKSGPVILVSNCPAVGVVKYMGTLTRFSSERQTNQDVVFDAFITDLDRDCSEGGSVTTDVSFSIRAKKGPAFQGSVHTINYYVVVIRDNYLVVTKKRYSTQIRFAPGQDTAGVRETIRQTFESFEEPRRYDYEVLIGFEVSPDELQFNVVR